MVRLLMLLGMLMVATPALAAGASYALNPGDRLEISIWKEEDMRREVLVLPDGTISYPLAGHLAVSGKTAQQVEEELTQRLGRFYTDLFLTVSVLETHGYQVYVIGEVREPGVFVMNRPLDIMQALSLAGGLTEFAEKREIVVLRRGEDGRQALPFDYRAVETGRDQSKNILLDSGDVLVVPTEGIF